MRILCVLSLLLGISFSYPPASAEGAKNCLFAGHLAELKRRVQLKTHFFYRDPFTFVEQLFHRETISEKGLRRLEGEDFLLLKAKVSGEHVYAGAYITRRGDVLLDIHSRSPSGHYHPELRAGEFLKDMFQYFDGRIERFVIVLAGNSMLLKDLNHRVSKGASIERSIEKLWGFEAVRDQGFTKATAAHLLRADVMGLDPTIREALIVIEPGPALQRSEGWWSRLRFWQR